MLRIIFDNKDGFVPSVFCDNCGEQIVKAKDGICEFVYGVDGAWLPQSGINFNHKGACTQDFRRKNAPANSDAQFAWFPIEAMLVYMVRNLDVDWEEAQRIAETFGK